MKLNTVTHPDVGNSLSVSLKKVWAIWLQTAQNFFQCKPCLSAEVSNRSHAGKTIVSLSELNYNYNTVKNQVENSTRKRSTLFRHRQTLFRHRHTTYQLPITSYQLPLHYYSTNNNRHLATLEEAVIRGLAPDNGLYMPEQLVPMPASFFETLHQKSFREISFSVANHLLGDDVEASDLKKMVEHSISFDAPLVRLDDNIFSLELFHGPTLAFKDFGARFMSQLLGHLVRHRNKEITVLVATSGDTGSAVANGFLGVDGIKVVVLYPSGKVSEIQEKQFTTLGRNITAIEVDGTFDDCQRLVKQAFMDSELQSNLFLTSANSINIARLIPQSFYYFYAWSQLGTVPPSASLPDRQGDRGLVFSVPSGNFGNLTAGLIAKRLGLPVHHFVASTNVNDIVPQYLHTKEFAPRASLSTISNAMDVGNPSNFARILDLYQGNWNLITQEITGYSFSDDETRSIMKSVFKENHYVLDPHGAIGLLGLKKYLQNNKGVTGIFLETAHPAKFKTVVEETIETSLELPDKLKAFMTGTKQSIQLDSNFSNLKSYLLQ